MISWAKKHFSRLRSIVELMMRLLNEEFPVAIGKSGQPGDAKHINYIAKKFIEGYKDIIEWRLIFLNLNVDPTFSTFLNLTSNLASNAIKETEDFVIRFHKETNEIFSDSYNNEEKRVIRFSINLGIPDSPEFDKEIGRLNNMINKQGINASVAEDISKYQDEIKRLINMIDEQGINTSVTENISKFHEEIERWKNTIDEDRIDASVDEEFSKLANEIGRLRNMINEQGINASVAEDLSKAHEIQDERLISHLAQTADDKEGKSDKDVTLAYKIVDDHPYSDVIRIRTKWKGKNRLLWVNKSDLDEFLSNQKNFREIHRLFDSGKKPFETRGRIKLYRGTVWRWNACVVKKGGGCFIATAVYDSASAPEVVYLRNFRDKILLSNLIGRLLVDVYYQISPPISGFISRHMILKKLVKGFFIDPIIGCIKVFY